MASGAYGTNGSGRSAHPGYAAGEPYAVNGHSTTSVAEGTDVVAPDDQRPRERFIPVTTLALVDRLTVPEAWPNGDADEARRLFKYLNFWRRQLHTEHLLKLLRAYEPFNPDSDLLQTRQYSAQDRKRLQKRVVAGVEHILKRANYERIDTSDVERILTKESHYGLDLHVDFSVFEECIIYYRGASTRRDQRRQLKKFMRKEEFDIPIFRRLFLLFKLKAFDAHVAELMTANPKLTRKEAERKVKTLRATIPKEVSDDNIYLKLFKNIPRSDVEMIFPNTRVRFRLMDKIKLSVTGGGALGMGVFGTAGKIAAGGLTATNPVALAGAVAGLGGIAFRQGVNFMNQKQRYMVVMAQNLYFHAMADNRGVLIKLSDRAAEEDVKEEMLLYSVLAKVTAKRSDLPHMDQAIERYLTSTFGVEVDFDLEDALERLEAEGLVQEDANGVLHTLPPRAAADHLDAKWDAYLDHLPYTQHAEGSELDIEDFPHA